VLKAVPLPSGSVQSSFLHFSLEQRSFLDIFSLKMFFSVHLSFYQCYFLQNDFCLTILQLSSAVVIVMLPFVVVAFSSPVSRLVSHTAVHITIIHHT